MPLPQPEPKVPASLQGQELQELLTAIASSSWDSIYAEAKLPKQSNKSHPAEAPRQRPMRPRSPIDLSLQASPPPVAEIIDREEKTRPEPQENRKPQITIPPPQPAWRGKLRFTAALIWMTAGVIFMVHAKGTSSPALHVAAQRTIQPPPVIIATAPLTVSTLPPAATRPSASTFIDVRTLSAAGQSAGLTFASLLW